LMVDVQQWKKLEKKADGISGEYIFCYFLNKNHKYKESVLKYAKLNNLKVVGCSANVKDAEWLQLISNNVSPREFLWLIHNAKAILTDSYHATIFSMLYHKDFITFERFENSDEICQNSRIYQLNDYFNISSRIVTPTPELKLEIPRIDYLDFENKLSELRKSSIKFLIDALES
jgi:exopolysaccharide biosynthesis predicted pyruvyltransferase EpsI